MGENFIIYNDYQKIGSTIRKLRIQAGISQIKLAKGICDRTTIIHLEKGRAKQPSIYVLNQICRRLSITLDDFFLIAFGGEINQLWLKKNEIDALMKTRNFDKAYFLANRYFSVNIHPVDRQYMGLVEGNYYYSLKDYHKAKDIYKTALSITTNNIEGDIFTLTEIRLINALIYCNWRIDNKLSTPSTIKYIKTLNDSIYNYPLDKDYRMIISLMLCTIHFYFTLKLYKDTITIINNAIELSKKYSCYDYLGNLWMMLANIYELLNIKEQSAIYYKKSNTFFELFDENTLLEGSLKHQMEIYDSIYSVS